MRSGLFLTLLWALVPSTAMAQRDPPVWECYLPSITITHTKNAALSLELLFKKERGAGEHREHQMYLLGCLQEDEAEILKVQADVSLLNKRQKDDEKLFLDVLLERGLVTVIDTQVAKRGAFAGQDNLGKNADGTGAGQDKAAFLKLNTLPFTFAPQNSALYDAISKLKHFQADKVDTFGYFESKFKLLVFVPVNDCKYATKVAEGVKGAPDFAHFGERLDAAGRDLSWSTPILYFRPLPYTLEFRKNEDGAILVYIN